MSYYVVVDLEMCRVPRSCKKRYRYNQETIQIGATLMNEEYEVIDTFNTFVKPEFGYLDGFIKKLTGITDVDLWDAPRLETALERFMAWLPENEKVTAVSWSNSDKFQFIHEIGAKGLKAGSRFEKMLETWIDCQPEFSEKMKMKKCYSLEEALIATDICTDGRAHNGLDDAYNTALLYAKMRREDKLVLNPYYERAHDDSKPERLCYGLGDILMAAGFITE